MSGQGKCRLNGCRKASPLQGFAGPGRDQSHTDNFEDQMQREGACAGAVAFGSASHSTLSAQQTGLACSMCASNVPMT